MGGLGLQHRAWVLGSCCCGLERKNLEFLVEWCSITECALSVLEAVAKAESGGEIETWVDYTGRQKKKSGYCNRNTMEGWVEGRGINKIIRSA